MTRIDGHTRILAHIGYPTHSFKAPLIYNPWFDHVGTNAAVVTMACREAGFPALLRSLFTLENILGALITMPHKISVLDYVDEILPRAAVAGASNAVRRNADGRLQADMFDGEGFTRGILRKGHVIAGSQALVVGSGGVGSAIAASLAAEGATRIALYDPRTESSDALAGRLRQHYPSLEVSTGSADPAGCDIVVNATPLGMNGGDPLPMDVHSIEPDAMVGEVVMTRRMTPFLEAVARRGNPYQVGTDMLYEMIPAYLEFFDVPVATPEQLRELSLLVD